MYILVLDTESSVCRTEHRRILVSVAYEVIVFDATTDTYMIESSGYHIVSPEAHTDPDPASLSVHQIPPNYAKQYGHPLFDVLSAIRRVVEHYRPAAIVGHDIVGDVALLVTEAMRCGLNHLFRWLGPTLICTKFLSMGPCAIPLPKHVISNTVGILKWPNLDESYRLLVTDTVPLSAPFEKHDARGDVARCRAIFNAIVCQTGQPQSL
jgi:hypothetical protein